MPTSVRHTADEHPPDGALIRFAFQFPSRVTEFTGVYRQGHGIWDRNGKVKLARMLPPGPRRYGVIWWEEAE